MNDILKGQFNTAYEERNQAKMRQLKKNYMFYLSESEIHHIDLYITKLDNYYAKISELLKYAGLIMYK